MYCPSQQCPSHRKINKRIIARPVTILDVLTVNVESCNLQVATDNMRSLIA